MSGKDTVRFFDTSGCLNLSRPPAGQEKRPAPSKRSRPGSMPIRGQVKIDLYNFDHIDFVDSKYVLTSPRSLEACARLDIKPASLLPIRLADVASDKHRYSTLVDIRDEMETERLANLQRCREEREKIIQEDAAKKSSRPGSAHVPASPATRDRNFVKTRTPSSARNNNGLHRATRVEITAAAPPPAPISHHGARSILKPTVAQWGGSEEQDDLRPSTSGSFLHDVQRMDQHLQRIGTSKQANPHQYVHGLENAKQMIEQRAIQSSSSHDSDHWALDKKQYELLLGHYDHELKLQKARENARRTEQEREAERHEALMHDFLDQNMAEERRQNELRRRLDKLHHSRRLYETLQAKNQEIQTADEEKRRRMLFKDIQRKDRRTENFVKDKQEVVHLSRALAKSSQDTREYLRETHETFDQKAKKAELTSSILISKAKVPVDRRYIQSSIRS